MWIMDISSMYVYDQYIFFIRVESEDIINWFLVSHFADEEMNQPLSRCIYFGSNLPQPRY